jgi:SHAQKYF class myb-like DNA-binding protein
MMMQGAQRHSLLSINSILNSEQQNENYNICILNPFGAFDQCTQKEALPCLSSVITTPYNDARSEAAKESTWQPHYATYKPFSQEPQQTSYPQRYQYTPQQTPQQPSKVAKPLIIGLLFESLVSHILIEDTTEQLANNNNKNVANKTKRKGWSREEHIRFLIGLYLFGRGNWKTISKIIDGKSPKQVQSHAQKYFLRQQQHIRTKRSIHDFCFIDLMALLKDKSFRENLSKNDSDLDKCKDITFNHSLTFL